MNLLSPWAEAAHSRSKRQAGAEQHWLDTTVKPLADRLEALIANCQTAEDRQRVAADILRELGQSDRGFIRLGGAATAAAIETRRTVHDFLVDALTIMNKD